MSSLPFPVRVAAGLVVTAVEEAGNLPRTLAGLPITAASRVLQMSMRAQQMVTELAIKGDTALEGARPVEDAPSWARFDEDLDVDEDFGVSAAADFPPSRRVGGSVTFDATPGAPRSANGSAPAAAGDVVDDDPALAGTPEALPGYETLTIAQLRGRLRTLSLDEVTQLLAWESAHADRPPFVTMLSNRITTLTAEQ